MEFVLNKKYPNWRNVERNDDGSARYMPAGVRLLEKSLLREFAADDSGGLLSRTIWINSSGPTRAL